MKNSLFRYLCLAAVALICSMASAQQKANYQLAEKFRLLTQNPIMKYSTEVNPTFINDTDCFYYSFTTREGEKYYYVNPKKKEKRLLFDTPELLSKIAVSATFHALTMIRRESGLCLSVSTTSLIWSMKPPL